jgi:hypothetical protein
MFLQCRMAARARMTLPRELRRGRAIKEAALQALARQARPEAGSVVRLEAREPGPFLFHVAEQAAGDLCRGQEGRKEWMRYGERSASGGNAPTAFITAFMTRSVTQL